MPKKPLVIYIAETNHGDISYSSAAEKIIKECDAKGLKTRVFSEFGNKEKGLGSEDEKSLVGYFPKEQVNKFVNERCVPMGNVFNRFTKLIPDVEKTFPKDVTPSQIFNQRKTYVDNPEILKLLAAEIAVRQQNQKYGIGGIGNQNSAGKDGADSKKFWGNANAFVQTTTHKEMAQDVSKMINGQEDVVIMIAGAPHIYGLDKALGSTFQNCEKLVVGNFQECEVDLSNLESIENAKRLCGEESCQQVGKITDFKVSHDKQAVVPEIISGALSEMVKKASLAEKLGLDAKEMAELKELSFGLRESGIKLEENSDRSQSKSFAEKMRSDATKGKSQGGFNEL
jgi:hypothetical protein